MGRGREVGGSRGFRRIPFLVTRVKVQESPELALAGKEKERSLQFLTHLIQAYTIIFMNVLVFVR